MKNLYKNKKIVKKVTFMLFEFNPLTVRIFTVFGRLLEGRVLHKEAWVAALLNHPGPIQVHKKVKFS